MTFVPHARMVLDDAKHVRHKLEHETDEREWRLAWTLTIVLLRTVGDVLDKVDGAGDPRVKSASATLYRTWKTGEREGDAVFNDLIKAERDSIVHEYATAMTEGPIPVMAIFTSDDGMSGDGPHWFDENLYRPMGAGRFEGEDGRDLIDQALDWWERQLDEIDRRVGK